MIQYCGSTSTTELDTTEIDMTTKEATASITDGSSTTTMLMNTTTTSNNSANEISLINIMKINMIMISFGIATCKLFMS